MCSLLQTHSKKGLFITYPLQDGKNSIGTSLDANIRLKGVGFQLEHCVIYCRNNEAQLENKSVENPVVLNGAELKTTERLKDGDRITINGREFEFSQPPEEDNFDFTSIEIEESFTPSMKMKTIASTSKIPLPTRIPTRKNVSLSASKLPNKSATTKSNYNNKGVMTPPNLRRNRRSRSTGKITKLGKHRTPKPSLRVSLFKKNLRLDKESPPDCFNNVTKLQTTPELIDLITPVSINEERETRSQFEKDNSSTPKVVNEESALLFEESPTSALETTSKTPRKSLSTIKESLDAEQVIDQDTVEVPEIETCTTKRSSRKLSKLIEFEEIGPRGAKRVRESIGECLQENKKIRMETTDDITLESSVAEVDSDIFTSSQEYIDDEEDDSDADIGNNRKSSIKNATIENSFNVYNIESVQNNITINIHTHKSISNISGIKELFETSDEPNSPTNDLCNVEGVGRLFKTPKVQKTPVNDLSKVDGVKSLFKTPKVRKSPLNDLSNVDGIRKVFATPKLQKSPLNDLTKIVGVKKMFSTPSKQQKSPINDLTDIVGVKQMFTTPKPQKSPRNDLTEVFGVKTMMRTPRLVKSPLNDLSNVSELDGFFKTPASKMARKTDEEMEENLSTRETGNEEEKSKNEDKPSRTRTRTRKAALNVEETVSTPSRRTRNKKAETLDNVEDKDEQKPTRNTRQRKTDKTDELPECSTSGNKTEQPSKISDLSKNDEKPIRVTRQRRKAAIEDDAAKPTTTSGRGKQLNNNNDTDPPVTAEMDNLNAKKSKRNLQVDKNIDEVESSTPVLQEDEDNENSSRPRTRRGLRQNIKPDITENLTPIPKKTRKTVDKVDENEEQIENTELQPRTRRGRKKNVTETSTNATKIEKADATNDSSTPLKKSRGRKKKEQKSNDEVVEEEKPIRVTRQRRNVVPENDNNETATTTRSTRRRKLDSVVDSENESSTKSTRNNPTESNSSSGREKKVEDNETRTEGRNLRSRKK